MNNDKVKLSKIWVLVPIWLPKRSLFRVYMAYMTLLLGNILTLSPSPRPTKGKSLRMSLGSLLFTKSVLHAKNQSSSSIYSQSRMVCLQGTHTENLYSKSKGLIKWKCTMPRSWCNFFQLLTLTANNFITLWDRWTSTNLFKKLLYILHPLLPQGRAICPPPLPDFLLYISAKSGTNTKTCSQIKFFDKLGSIYTIILLFKRVCSSIYVLKCQSASSHWDL